MFTPKSKVFDFREGVKFTEGVSFLKAQNNAFWLLEAIADAQGLDIVKNTKVQTWRLSVRETGANVLLLSNSKKENVFKRVIPNQYFKLKGITLIFKNGILRLENEVAKDDALQFA